MKKRFIIIGMITLGGMLNLALMSNFSWGSEDISTKPQLESQAPLLFPKKEYLEIIQLLKQQIQENEKQIENAEKFYQSITGSKIQKSIIKKDGDLFLQHSVDIYPPVQTKYSQQILLKHKGYVYLGNTINIVNSQEKRGVIEKMKYNDARAIVDMRLKYNGIIEKAVSLQTFQNAEKRFTQIANFLNDINKTKDLREVFELQTQIRSMSSMLQNEYAKLQMVRNLSNNEEDLIDIQKRKLYGKIVATIHRAMPSIRLQ